MPTGPELIADVDACSLGEGQCAFWWLGQHGFIVKLGERILYLDPFLSDHPRRLVPSLVRPEQVTNAHLVFGSHDHTDHIDRDAWPAIAQASPGTRFVVPELLLDGLARELGIAPERFVGMNDGDTLDVDGVAITGVAAAHEFLDRDEASGRYPYLGFVIEQGGCVVYHAGDTCSYEGLQTKLLGRDFDVAFLPINGRDAKRLAGGCIGNMTYQEAADLAGALAPRLTVPAHFDMFEGNTEDPHLFTEYMAVKYPHLRTIVPEHGRREVVGSPGPLPAEGGQASRFTRPRRGKEERPRRES